jgi:hypothetical protein
VDLASKVCVDLIENDCLIDPPMKNSWTKYYHLTNPENGSWASMVPVIQDYLKGQKMKPIGFQEWVDVLEQSMNEPTTDTAKNPALKLLGFYSEMRTGSEPVEMDTTEARNRSKTMQELRRVNGDWMRIWMEQWKF